MWGATVVKRALAFLGVLVVSLVLFPVLALLSASLRIPQVQHWLFPWPMFVLVPYGFVGRGYDVYQPLLPDTAILFALGAWLFIAVVHGYLWKEKSIKAATWAALPFAIVIVVVVHCVLMSLGLSPYPEGP